MKKYLPIICQSALFDGVSRQEAGEMLHCLNGRTASFQKGEYLLRAGEPGDCLGLLLEGQALVVHEDFWGGRNLLASLGPGQSFAESFAAADAPLSVSVTTETGCTVLFLEVERILNVCPTTCAHHSRIIRNLLTVLARKNVALSEKLEHLGQRTTRSKLLSYLSAQSQRAGGPAFDIPFSRQQLADYLLVERSALSRELGKMRDEGIVSFQRNHFRLR